MPVAVLSGSGWTCLAPPPSSQTTQQPSTDFSTVFAYRVVKGPCKDKHYGLELAKLAALPDDVMEQAEMVARKLSGMEAKGELCLGGNQ
jgi:DNA mismatch repair protein MSH4